MVNLRYHIVSLVAVFLALGIGVFMGSAVIDSFTVDVLRTQQRNLEQSLRTMEEDRQELRAELAERDELAGRFAEEADRLVAGTLTGTGVVVLAAEGVSAEAVTSLRWLLDAAGAVHAGDTWLTGRFALEEDGDRAALAEALGVSPNLSSGVLRSIALSRLAEALRTAAALPGDTGELEAAPPPAVGEPGAAPPGVAPGPLAVVDALAQAGFVQVELPDGDAPDGRRLPLVGPGTRFVVVGGHEARVPDAQLTRPLVAGLAVADTLGVVVTAPAPPAAPDDPDAEPAPGIVAMVRGSGSLAARVSTVEAVDTVLGRLAAVLAIEDLEAAVVGHYGPEADRLLPPHRG